MLLAGALAAIMVYIKDLGLTNMLIAILASMVIFYLIGSVIELILNSFYKKEEEDEKVSDDGEVIEKEPSDNAETNNPAE